MFRNSPLISISYICIRTTFFSDNIRRTQLICNHNRNVCSQTAFYIIRSSTIKTGSGKKSLRRRPGSECRRIEWEVGENTQSFKERRRSHEENHFHHSFIPVDANGNRINIASSEVVPQDLTSITMNVDNFLEAYDLLTSHGFVNPRGDKVTDTSSSRATMLFAPSGFPINISQHIRKEDK